MGQLLAEELGRSLALGVGGQLHARSAREMRAEAMEGEERDPRLRLDASQVLEERPVEAHEQHVLAPGREPLGPLDREHGLARPGAPGHDHAPFAPEPPQQGRLLVGEQHELLLLLEELGGHRHLDANSRCERLAQDRRAVEARRLAAVP